MIALFMLMIGCGTAGDSSFHEGLSAIRSGDATVALAGFQQSLAEGGRDGAVYHGLGNALYRLGHHGEAAAAWRRGLALSPRNGDIAANLDFVRKRFKDKLEPPSTHRSAFFWQSFLSPLEGAILAATAIAFGLWMAVWGRLRVLRGLNGLGANAVLLAVASVVIGCVLALAALDTVAQRAGGVVTVAEVEVRSALGPSGLSLFVLHEGAEVRIEDQSQTHILLSLSDGRKGWVNGSALRTTNPAHPFVFTER
jgi:tetratricopeptide (TPR) repeat protein